MEKNSLSERKFLLTSLDYKIKIIKKEEKKEDIKTASITSKSLPQIRHRTLISEKKESSNTIQLNSPKNEQIFLRNLRQFVFPINKSNSELKEIKKIKNNLIANKLKESLKYKLKINPNYFKNYGLNDFVKISNNDENKKKKFHRYNNISTYNNIIKKTVEDKNDKISKSSKKQKKLLLKYVPYILKNSKNNNGIFNFFNNASLIDENSIWRGKNINDLIHNRINIDFFKSFLRNSKSLGKIKLFK